MTMRPGQAKGPSVSTSGGSGGIPGLTSVVMTDKHIPYYDLGTTTFRDTAYTYNTASKSIEGIIGADLLFSVQISAIYSSVNVSTMLPAGSSAFNIAAESTIMLIQTNGSAFAGSTLGIVNAGSANINILTFADGATSLRIYTESADTTTKIPIYIGQKTTNYDDWLARFNDTVVTLKGTLTNITTNLSVGGGTVTPSWWANQVGKVVLFGLGNVYNATIGPGQGNTFWVQNAYNSAGATWNLTASHAAAGRPSRIMMEDGNIYFAVNAQVGGLANAAITWVTCFTMNGDGTLTLDALTASTLTYLNASKKITSLPNAAGYLSNNGAGVLSWGAVSVSGFIKDPGGITDGQVLRYETGGNARNSPIAADSMNGTIGVNTSAGSGELITGRRDPANIVLWALSGNSYEAYHCHGGDSQGGVWNFRESYAGTLFGLTLNSMLYFGTTSGKATSVVYGSINSNDTSRVPIYIGQKTTNFDNWEFRIDSSSIATFKRIFDDDSERTVTRYLRKRNDAVYGDPILGAQEFCFQGTSGGEIAYCKLLWGINTTVNRIGTFNLVVSTDSTPGNDYKSVIKNTSQIVTVNADGYFTSAIMKAGATANVTIKSADNCSIQAAAGWGTYLYSKGSTANQIGVSTGCIIQAELDADNSIVNSGVGRVNFQGIAAVTTSISATGYLPIKISGVAYKMLVST
jgi:hypothetical protein